MTIDLLHPIVQSLHRVYTAAGEVRRIEEQRDRDEDAWCAAGRTFSVRDLRHARAQLAAALDAAAPVLALSPPAAPRPPGEQAAEGRDDHERRDGQGLVEGGQGQVAPGHADTVPGPFVCTSCQTRSWTLIAPARLCPACAARRRAHPHLNQPPPVDFGDDCDDHGHRAGG